MLGLTLLFFCSGKHFSDEVVSDRVSLFFPKAFGSYRPINSFPKIDSISCESGLLKSVMSVF